jgi:SAM-dependent methyltransferase
VLLRHPKRTLQDAYKAFVEWLCQESLFAKSRFAPQTHVTPEAVVWGYRLFLDREPENAQAIGEKARCCDSLQELRQVFLTSDEFKQRNPLFHTPSLSGDEPRMPIDDACREDDLQRLFDHIQKTWGHLGETEPYWSVVTYEQFKKSYIQRVREEFYNTGEHDVRRLISTLDRNGIDHTTLRSCLEYGCGVGRITSWLSEKFQIVYGYDISLPHLREAELYLAQKNLTNVSFKHMKQFYDIYNLPSVDLVYSVLVLQHNPPPIIHCIIRQFLKCLNPGGIAYFQVPTYKLGYSFSLKNYLCNNEADYSMEMHVLPQSSIFSIIQQGDGQVIEVIEDDSNGLKNKEVSNIFLIQKREDSGIEST